MSHYKRRCKCRKCVLKLEVTNSLGELIPGPVGPPGPQGQVIAEVPRSLKVQMIGSEIMPIIIQGFSWEADVLQPPGWPVPGTFTYYRATVLDQEGFSVAEMFNNYGGINHTQVDEVHTSVLAHYRQGVLQDLHSVSSQTPGSENFLLAQTLHDVVINDQLYFAISPNVSSLTTFNYTLGSIKMKPGGKLPPPGQGANWTINLPPQNAFVGGQTFCYVATQDINVGVIVTAAGGGGGAGETSTNDGGGAKIGRGGGGGAGASFPFNANMMMTKGDILTLILGDSGRGGKAGTTGTDADGENGQISNIKFNNTPVFPFDIMGFCGGKGGVNDGDGGSSPFEDVSGSGGGGGGAPLCDDTPGTPGKGGTDMIDQQNADDGGTDPRNGGKSVELGNIMMQAENGGKGGSSTSDMGSGGGAGGGGTPFGGNGGNGGYPGEPGKPGDPGKPANVDEQESGGGGGGGGGSGGLPAPGGDPVLGGDGGKGFFSQGSIFST